MNRRDFIKKTLGLCGLLAGGIGLPKAEPVGVDMASEEDIRTGYTVIIDGQSRTTIAYDDVADAEAWAKMMEAELVPGKMQIKGSCRFVYDGSTWRSIG